MQLCCADQTAVHIGFDLYDQFGLQWSLSDLSAVMRNRARGLNPPPENFFNEQGIDAAFISRCLGPQVLGVSYAAHNPDTCRSGSRVSGFHNRFRCLEEQLRRLGRLRRVSAIEINQKS